MTVRKNFVSRFLFDVVHTLADINYQQRVWVNGEGPEVDSFDETINDFYYYFRSFKKDYQSDGLSKKEFESIVNLEKRIGEITYTGGRDKEIIYQPAWQEVIQAAKTLSVLLKRFEKYE